MEKSILELLEDSPHVKLNSGSYTLKDFSGSLDDEKISLTGNCVNLCSGKIVNYTKGKGRTSILVTGISQVGILKNVLVKICGITYPVISVEKDRIILVGEVDIPDCSQYNLLDLETVVKFENFIVQDGNITLKDLVIAGNFVCKNTKINTYNVVLLDNMEVKYGDLNIEKSVITCGKICLKHSKFKMENTHCSNTDFSLRFGKNHIKRCIAKRSDIRVLSGFTYLRKISGISIIASDAATVDIKDISDGEVHSSSNSTVIQR